jgi:hypothetical protein
MKLIKVLFLLIFITSVKSYTSQIEFVEDNRDDLVGFDCFTGGIEDGSTDLEVIVSKYQYNKNNVNVSCATSSDGKLQLQVMDGVVGNNYSYTWTFPDNSTINGTVTPSIAESNPTIEITSLGIGTYELIVYDDGCLDDVGNPLELEIEPIILNAPGALSIRSPASGYNLSPSCFPGSGNSGNGQLKARAKSGVKPYTYSWDNTTTLADDILIDGPTNSLSTLSATATLAITAGVYSVEVEDQNGCTVSSDASHNLTVVDVDQVFSNSTITQAGCVNEDNTQLTSVPTGGPKDANGVLLGNYTYSWSVEGSGVEFWNTNQTPLPPTTNLIGDVGTPNGTANPMRYVLTVQTAVDRGETCTTIPADTIIVANIPTAPTVDAGGDLTGCVGSVINLIGIAPNPANIGGAATAGIWSVAGGLGLGVLSQTTYSDATYVPDAADPSTLTFILTTTDGGSCGNVFDTKTISVNSAATISGTLNTCIGQSTTLTGSAPSTSPTWTSANELVATVDALGIVTGISAGTSVITYSDDNGCSVDETITVNALPAAPTITDSRSVV